MQKTRFPKRYLAYAALLLGLVFVESMAHSYWLNAETSYYLSLVYLLAGMGIALIPLLPVQFPSYQPSSFPVFVSLNTWLMLFLGLFAIGYYGWLKSPWIFDQFPISPDVADMLPVMQVMGNRFLEGGTVYDLIPEIWGGMPPIYLPTMWLPYLPALAYDFDMRWISQGMVLLGLAFSFRLFHWDRIRPVSSLLVLVPIGLLTQFLFSVDFRLFGMTEEGIVISFYLFLAYALMTSNPWLKGIAITLCLMSRYVLVFWLPFYVLYIFLKQSRREAYIIAGVSFVLSMILMLGTGAFQNLSLFLEMPKIYLDAVQDPANAWKYLPTINESLGLGKYLGIERIGLLHKSLFFVSLLSPLSFFLWILRKPQSFHSPFWAICSLKMSLVLFYQFLVINPLYLFYTSTFFSYAILYYYLGHVEKNQSF